MNPDEDLRTSMAAHKAGLFTEAEAGYLRVLEALPEHPKALYYLGLLHFHRGDTPAAIDLLQRCVSRAPSNAPAWNTLGGLLIAAGRPAEAKEAYRHATVAAPTMGEGWYNHGICLRDEGDIEGALRSLRASVTNQPDYFRSYEALAMLLYQLGRMREAAEAYGEWAARDPQSAKARHMAAATSQQNVPARAADDYVRSLFDDSARSFDADLEKLRYRAPQVVAAALLRTAGERLLSDVLDAGCGTGLCGPLMRAHCGRLVGVDLSPQMMERAKERGCYDELVVAELMAFMRSRPCAFDGLISADTLVYFGSLGEPLRAAHEALRVGGALVFTLEALTGDSNADYHLGAHGRYAHAESYIRRAVGEAGFTLDILSREKVREERGVAVESYLVTARK